MARTVDLVGHEVRRDAFIDAAQRLIQTKGYEQMSVRDVLDDVGVSKGAFYHYFASKSALLEAVVERIVEAAVSSAAPLAAEPHLAALPKLEGVFAGISRWKTERTELMLALVEVWESDDNAIVREKVRRAIMERLAPMLGAILAQGRDEGVFSPSLPEEAARVCVSLLQGLNEVAVRLFLDRRAGRTSYEVVERTLDAYMEGFERILGLEPGSLHLVDRAVVREWFGPTGGEVQT